MTKRDDAIREIDREFLDACTRGSLPDAQAAIDAGANPYSRGDYMETAVHRSILSHNPNMLRYTLDTLCLPKDARDDLEQTPAHWAAKADDGPALEILDERGANLTLRDRSGMTPEDVAKAHTNREASDTLRELKGPKKPETGFASRVGRGNRDSHHLRVVESRSSDQPRTR